MPPFLVQIIHTEDGKVAKIPGGGNLETDLIELCVQHIMTKNVGFLRTASQVEQAVREGLKEAIYAMKEQTKFIV